MQFAYNIIQTCNYRANIGPVYIQEELDAWEKLSDFILSIATFSFGMWKRGSKQTLKMKKGETKTYTLHLQ